MERLNYSIVVVGQRDVHCYVANYCFDDRQSAERYAEGMSHGLYLTGKKWAVVMLLDGKYNPHTTITKNLTQKQAGIMFQKLNITVTTSLPQ